MIDTSNMTPAQLRQLAEQATAEAVRLRKAGSEELRRRLEAIAEAEGYAVRVQFVTRRRRKAQAGAEMARELAAVGLEPGAMDDRIDAEGAE